MTKTTDLTHCNLPKTLKPIEFKLYFNKQCKIEKPSYCPNEFSEITLISKEDFLIEGESRPLSLMRAKADGVYLFYLGYWNDGVVE